MTSLTEFHVFPRFPFELRLKVWDFALRSDPRIITIACERELLDRERRFAKSFTSQTPPPALLHVCRETRDEALSIYQPYFKTETSPIYTYVSFKHDMIRCSDSLLEYMGKDEVRGIQRMTLEVRDVAYFGHFNMDVLMRMKNLQELELITQQGQQYNWYTDLVGGLTRDFDEARRSNPGWESPRIKILESDTGRELTVIAGGALLPGWKYGDEYPEDLN